MNKDYVTRNEFNSQMSKTDKYIVVYDKDGGSQLDFGMSGGILGAVPVNIDLSKFRILRVFVVTYKGVSIDNNGGTNNIFEMDLTTPIYNNCCISKNVFSYGVFTNGKTEYFDVYTQYDKTNKTIKFSFAYNGQLSNNSSSYYVYKMEGIF